ncbi:hypothetical protein ACFYW1_31345 [Streptomyces sp. NPDC002669]|uniref:hypothetical protein n=1 Tax=Streptomyces sp. NPDC002669 TaxID=3364658 RepID=UPI0036BDF49A
MQSTEASAILSTDSMDEFADEHPAGRITLGASGRLGLRSSILSATDGNNGCTTDLPWTTMTWN